MDVRRRATALLAGLVLAAMELVAPPTPVAATPADSDTLVFAGFRAAGSEVVRNGEHSLAATPELGGHPLLAGDFSAAPGTDLFVYNPGSAPDGILHVEPTGTGVTTSFTAKTVRGHLRAPGRRLRRQRPDRRPLVRLGRAPDSIWLFRPDGSHVSLPTTVNGSYTPFVVEATGDGHDDVFWYGPGTDPDHLWVFGEGASPHVATDVGQRPVPPAGRPLPGHARGHLAGAGRLVRPAGVRVDVDLPPPTVTPRSRCRPSTTPSPWWATCSGTGRDVIFWNRIGDDPDDLVTFAPDGTPSLRAAPPVRGGYTPVVGDFDGNGREDIAWTHQRPGHHLDASATPARPTPRPG